METIDEVGKFYEVTVSLFTQIKLILRDVERCILNMKVYDNGEETCLREVHERVERTCSQCGKVFGEECEDLSGCSEDPRESKEA